MYAIRSYYGFALQAIKSTDRFPYKQFMQCGDAILYKRVALVERAQVDFPVFFHLSEKQDRHMEPFLIDVYPIETKEYKLSSHEGEEFIFVMDGEIEILYGKEKS